MQLFESSQRLIDIETSKTEKYENVFQLLSSSNLRSRAFQ